MERVAVFVGNKTSLNSTIVKECARSSKSRGCYCCLVGWMLGWLGFFAVVLPVCFLYLTLFYAL